MKQLYISHLTCAFLFCMHSLYGMSEREDIQKSCTHYVGYAAPNGNANFSSYGPIVGTRFQKGSSIWDVHVMEHYNVMQWDGSRVFSWANLSYLRYVSLGNLKDTFYVGLGLGYQTRVYPIIGLGAQTEEEANLERDPQQAWQMTPTVGCTLSINKWLQLIIQGNGHILKVNSKEPWLENGVYFAPSILIAFGIAQY